MRSTRQLVLALALAFAGYVALFVVMHFQSLGWSESPLRIFGEVAWWAPKHTTAGLQHGLLFGCVLALLGAGYLATLSAAARTEPDLCTLVVAALACSLPLLVLPNLLSQDVHGYVVQGRIPVVYGGNPFFVAPSAYPDDPYVSAIFWKDATTSYGPVWVYVSIALTWLVELVGPSPAVYVLAYKLLALCLHLACGVLIWRIASDAIPRRRSLAAAIWLLNPLALIELVGNAHNDAVMTVLLLGGVRAAQRGRRWPAVALLACAGLTKIYAFPIVALYGCVLVRRAPDRADRLRIAGSATAIVAVVAVALYAPWWRGISTLHDPSGPGASNSLAQLIGFVVVDFRSETVAFTAIPRTLAIALLAVVVVGGLAAAWSARTWSSGLRSATWYVLVFCCFGAFWFWPWYAVFGVAFAALAAGNTVAARAAIALSLSALYLYVSWAIEPHAPELHRFRALFVFGPPAAIVLHHLVRRARAT